MPVYTKVQCIAYEVDTFPKTTNPNAPTIKNILIDGVQYNLPVWDVTKEYAGEPLENMDTHWRRELMKQARFITR